MELLKQHIEALIFCSEQSISLDEIAASLKLSFDWELEDAEIVSAIEEIKGKYLSEDFAFELVEISEGYQFLTKKVYYPAISALIQHKAKKKLSVSQMETLAIIAYRQPISKSEVEHIRGVSCDYAVQKLLEKELVEISGKSDGPGRPVLYSTSRSFMDYFGIKSVKDLPQLKDLHVEQNEIGQPSDSLSAEDYIPVAAGVEETAPASSENEVSNEFVIDENETVISVDEEISTVFNENEESSEDIRENEDLIVLADSEENTLQTEFIAEEEMDIPDRKAIFLENESNIEAEEEKSESNENEEN